MTTVFRARWACAVGAALALILVAPAAAHDRGKDDSVRVVAGGLDNPRGLDFGPGGDLYVAESGRGGSGPCLPGPTGGQVCFGLSGAVTRLDPRGGDHKRIAEGLPSLAAPDGSQASGPSDVSFRFGFFGFLTIGFGGDPANRAQLPPAGAGMAQLYRLSPFGHLRAVADLGAFEAANDPDKDQPRADPTEPTVDTNPNSVDASGFGRVAVADAGGNDVLAVRRNGDVDVRGVIPFQDAPAPAIPGFPVPPGTPIPTESVPTSVVRGPDGALYVGELTGFPFPDAGASVWRIARGSAPEKFASGFTQITDLRFGRDGSLYVLEFAKSSMLAGPSPGALIRVRPDGTRDELAAGALLEATGLALGHRFAYVSNRGSEAGNGEVVRIPLDD
jgi:hypothetical protein